MGQKMHKGRGEVKQKGLAIPEQNCIEGPAGVTDSHLCLHVEWDLQLGIESFKVQQQRQGEVKQALQVSGAQ